MVDNKKVIKVNFPKHQSANPLDRLIAYWQRPYRLMDRPLLVICALLLLVGLVFVYSGAMYVKGGPRIYLLKQTLGIALGLASALVIVSLPYRYFESFGALTMLNFFSIAGLLLTAFTAKEQGGAASWLNFGRYNLQISEFSKYLVILLANLLISQFDREIVLDQAEQQYRKHFRLGLTVIVGSIILVAIQPDTGMALIMVGSLMMMILILRFGLKEHVMAYGIIGFFYLLTRWISTHFSEFLINRKNHQFHRIGIFVNPFKYPMDEGYQSIKGFQAFRQGGLWGVGIGNGQVKGLVPACHTDFILSVIGEEIGLLGVLLVLTLIFALLIRMYVLAAKCSSSQSKGIIIGITNIFFLQIVANVGGLLSLIPLTGVTLPFISYGGSSVIATVCAIGIIQRVVMAEKAHEVVFAGNETDRIFERIES